jgi:hypothetical protein
MVLRNSEYVETLEKQIEFQEKEIERLQREMNARIYYQDIVYAVCNSLDMIRGNSAIEGGIVCGTLEEPTTEVQDAMASLTNKIKRTITV